MGLPSFPVELPLTGDCLRMGPPSFQGHEFHLLQVFRVWAILLGIVEERMGDGGMGWADSHPICDSHGPF